MDRKSIDTGGITDISLVPGGTQDWYYGLSFDGGDMYEAEEIYRDKGTVEGNSFCLVHYPDGEVFRPFLPKACTYIGAPVYYSGGIFLLRVSFRPWMYTIYRFDCRSHEIQFFADGFLGRDCYNLMLHTAPPCLTRQGADDTFEILWPEQTGFKKDPRESFFLRDWEKLYFNKWYEEGDGPDYRYWEETVVRGLDGTVLETLPGDVRIMPNGEIWHIH